jgi:hypothetical protein
MVEKNYKPPASIEVEDLKNFARLTMGWSNEYRPLLWGFTYKRKNILGYLSSLPYWKGNLPIFAYTVLDKEPKGYLAYTNLEREEVFFTNDTSNNKFVYAAIVEIDEVPEIISYSIKKGKVFYEKPVSIKVKNINSLLRVLLIMSEGGYSPPLWLFNNKDKNILGAITPFYDYYEANALPVFFYIESNEISPKAFIKYLPSEEKEILSYTDYISDMKYFYARVIKVKNMPFYTKRKSLSL